MGHQRRVFKQFIFQVRMLNTKQLETFAQTDCSQIGLVVTSSRPVMFELIDQAYVSKDPNNMPEFFFEI